MKARALIENSSYGPDVLRTIFEAFDQAWQEISPHFDTETAERARLRLAHACLLVVEANANDPARLKRDALEVLALAGRSHR